MLACYLDDSGEKSDPIATMAGYISTAEAWQLFEAEARSLFDAIELPFLHAVDLHHLRGEFKGWSRGQASEFANCFFGIVERHIGFGLEFSVLKSPYELRKFEHGVGHQVSPYAFCFHGLVDRLLRDDGFLRAVSNEAVNVTFVVEAGHKNDADVKNRFELIRRRAPNLWHSIQFRDKKSLIALQAADFLAYFSRRLRTKDRDHPRFEAEKRFFEAATGKIRHLHFLAVDFSN